MSSRQKGRRCCDQRPCPLAISSARAQGRNGAMRGRIAPSPLDIAAAPGLGPLLAAPRQPVVVPPVIPILLDARHRFRFPASSVKISQRLKVLPQGLVRSRSLRRRQGPLPADLEFEPAGGSLNSRVGADGEIEVAPQWLAKLGNTRGDGSSHGFRGARLRTDVDLHVDLPPLRVFELQRQGRSGCDFGLEVPDVRPVEPDTVHHRTLGTDRIDQIRCDRDPDRLRGAILQPEAKAVRLASIDLVES